MATSEKSGVIVELYDLPLTERKDDRFGRVVTTKSLTEDDLVAIAVSRRTDLNATTLRASMDILKGIAVEQIANGASVKFGLGYFNLGVSGVFIGDNAKWDATQHSLFVKATPTAELRETVAASTVDVRGMAAIGIAINSLVDVASGAENSRLTPGGGINLTGSKIKIEGSDPAVGISLTNQATSEVTIISKTLLLVNEPSKITFIVPTTMVKGDYKLTICTQYSPSIKSLKEPRTYTFDYVLSI